MARVRYSLPGSQPKATTCPSWTLAPKPTARPARRATVAASIARRLVRRRRSGLSAQHRDEPPQRHERPRALQQEEAPLLAGGGQPREHRGAGEVEREIGPRRREQPPELRRRERHEDHERADDLDDLHGS